MSNLPDRPPEDADRETHRARIQAAVEAYIESTKTYIDVVLKKMLLPVTRWHTGTARSINLSAKTAVVDLDPFPEGEGQTGVTCGWGRKTWTSSQLVGKRVRVMIDLETKAHWIDDVLS
jgi:hypothetical protein